MTDEVDLFRRAGVVFDEASELAPGERAAYVALACAGDDALRDAVNRLLQTAQLTDDFLAGPAAEFALPLLAAGDRRAAPKRLGPFRILRDVGHGGMGAVYLGERDDGQFQQRVALKLVRGGFASDLLVRRFVEERSILASLEHPGIARLIDGGVTPEGMPWFAMEFVEGDRLDRYCSDNALPVEERLSLFRNICRAVAYAHRRRVVHRDLKPDNILVTAEGEVKLLDFGVARFLDVESDQGSGTEPATGAVFRAMTPEYAAPEQVRGEAGTAASDVYALGVMLYELVTGVRPFDVRGAGPAEVERIVCDTVPVRPSIAAARAGRPQHGLSGDLDTIVMTALQKEPGRRYPSATHLLDDLERFAAGRPIAARDDSIVWRARRLVSRRRNIIAASLLVAVSAAATASLTTRSVEENAFLGDGSLSRIVVLNLAATAVDDALAAALTDAIRIDLAQVPGLRVLSEQQVAGTLLRMGQPALVVISDSVAHELAARDGVQAIVTGDVRLVGGRYHISARLVSAVNGDLLAAARQSADSVSLIDAVGLVTARLRRGLGETLRSVEAGPALSQVTTVSLPALRAYSAAMRVNDSGGDRGEVIRLLEEALSHDAEFAAAHRMLGAQYTAISDHGRAAASLERAFAARHRLALRERYLTVGSYHANVTGDLAAALEAYDAQLSRDPADVAALNNKALVHRRLGQFREQQALLQRVIEQDSSIPSVWLGLAQSYASTGDHDDAVRTMQDIDRRFPGNGVAPMTWSYVYASVRDWPAAERHIRQRLAESRRNRSVQAERDAHQTLGQILMVLGRLDESETHLRAARRMALDLDMPRSAIFNAVQLGWLELRHRNRPDRARAILDSALTVHPLRELFGTDRPYHEVAGLLAELGETEWLRRLIDVAEADTVSPMAAADRDALRGMLAGLDGRYTEAVRLLARAAEAHACTICLLPALGRHQERIHQPRQATETYQRYLAAPHPFRFEYDAPHLAFVQRRLAALGGGAPAP